MASMDALAGVVTSAASRRSLRSETCGMANGMRATWILRLPRVIRAAIVDSLTRKALATSAVDRPHRRRRVSATCVSGAIAG